MAFCKEYNAATQDKVGTVIPVEITVFEVSCQHEHGVLYTMRTSVWSKQSLDGLPACIYQQALS